MQYKLVIYLSFWLAFIPFLNHKHVLPCLKVLQDTQLLNHICKACSIHILLRAHVNPENTMYFTKANISTKYSGSRVAEGTHGSKDAQTVRSRLRILLLVEIFKRVILCCTLKV